MFSFAKPSAHKASPTDVKFLLLGTSFWDNPELIVQTPYAVIKLQFSWHAYMPAVFARQDILAVSLVENLYYNNTNLYISYKF